MIFGEGLELIGIGVTLEEFLLLSDEELSFENIEPDSGEDALIEAANQRIGFDEFPAGGIDEDAPVFEEVDILLIDEVMGFFGIWRMERDDISSLEQLVEWYVLEIKHFREETVLESVIGQYLHPKALGDLDDMEANFPGADYTQSFTLEIKALKTFDSKVTG